MQSIVKVLQEMGIQVDGSGNDVQIRCPFHSGGQETNPSARVYVSTNSMYCFRCHRSWSGDSLYAEYYGLPLASVTSGRHTTPNWRRLDNSLSELIESAGILHKDQQSRMLFLQKIDVLLVNASQGATPIPEMLFAVTEERKQLLALLNERVR